MPIDLPSLVQVSELEKRLGVPEGSLAGLDLTRAEAALDDVSDLVRAESGRNWVADNGIPIVPPAVRVVVLQVAKRVYNNPDNYTSESAGDYTWQGDQKAIGLYLSDTELRILAAATRLAAMEEATAAGITWTGSGSLTTKSAYGYGPVRYLTGYGPARYAAWYDEPLRWS